MWVWITTISAAIPTRSVWYAVLVRTVRLSRCSEHNSYFMVVPLFLFFPFPPYARVYSHCRNIYPFIETVRPTGALVTLVRWRKWISLHFSWFFQGTTAIFFFFMMYILFRFGHIHLSRPQITDRRQHRDSSFLSTGSAFNPNRLSTNLNGPEFSTFSYMCLCFTSGIASGFFALSVSQTIWNQEGHYFANPGYRSQDEIDLFAINMTVTQWGFAGWMKYLLVAVNVCLAVHCFQLPMSLRSCWYPMLRHYTWGWIGDCIDGLAIVASISGVCVSMGLGAVQLVSGFIFLGWVDSNATAKQLTSIQGTIIWVITVLFSASVVSGLHGGVRFLSTVALAVNVLFLCLVFILDDSKFLLNLIVQETGYYAQNSMFEINFWTDAFGQLREGSGRAVDGKAADQEWTDAWSVFYAAWW
jgi:choline-glycine betaine transporter